jgi:F-box domain
MVLLLAKRSASAGVGAAAIPAQQPSLNDLDDDMLLHVLRLLPPHHRAIARLVCRHLSALVGPVVDHLGLGFVI